MNTPVTTSTGSQPAVMPKGLPPFKISPVHRGHSRIKLLIYGKPGAGKTTLAASAIDVPQMEDVLLIDVEDSDMVLHDNSKILVPEKIMRTEVGSFKQIGQMHEWLAMHCRHRDADDIDKLKVYESWLTGVPIEEIESPKKFRTVIIDSLTELEAYCMYNLLGLQGEFNTAMISDDMKTAEFSEYKKNNNIINLLVRAFRDLPMNVIMICGEQWQQDEKKQFHYTPALTGKLPNQIQGYFDMVGYLATGKPTEESEAPRRLFVQPVGKWDAKNRRASFKGSYFDDPSMGKIMEAIGLSK